jgi:hypothetical protein
MIVMIIIMFVVILVVLMAVALTKMLTVVLSGQVLSNRIVRIGIDGQAAPLHITRMFPGPLATLAPPT